MKSWQPTCFLTIGIQRYLKTHTSTSLQQNIIMISCYAVNPFVLSDYSQLDEGVNLSLKPRPGSDLTNSNAPSPPHKVQRSVSSTQKPVRRSTDQGALICRFSELKTPLDTQHPLSILTLSFFFVCRSAPQAHTRKGLREKTSLELRILGGKVQVAPPKFHPVPSSPANAKRAPHPLL